MWAVTSVTQGDDRAVRNGEGRRTMVTSLPNELFTDSAYENAVVRRGRLISSSSRSLERERARFLLGPGGELKLLWWASGRGDTWTPCARGHLP